MGMIGFVGLGRMGHPMASNLARKGFRLAVHDINRDAVEELELLQAKGVASVAEATRGSEIVVTMLPNSAVVTAIVAGEGGILQHATRGTLIMDMSTVSPETTDALAAKARGKSLFDGFEPHMKNAFIQISHGAGEAIYNTARAINAKRIVEFGTSFGVSTIYLACAVRDNGGGKVIGSELEPTKVAAARDNINAAGLSAYVEFAKAMR